jgi:hypothetical protein
MIEWVLCRAAIRREFGVLVGGGKYRENGKKRMNVSPLTCIRIEESSDTRRCGLRGLGQPLANGQRRGTHAGALPLQMTARFSHQAA